MSELEIRALDPTREADLCSVAALDRLINGQRPQDEVLPFYRDYSGHVLLAEQSGTVVGYATLSYPYWNRIAMMDHLAVAEGCRRAGVGRTLCHAIDAKARALGARIVCVQTALWNYDAARFYARVGYRARGVFAEYLGTGNDLVWLDKALPTLERPPYP